MKNFFRTCRIFLFAAIAAALLSACGPSLVEEKGKVHSPSMLGYAEVLRLNYDATVPYVWQVNISHENGQPEEVARIVDPQSVVLEWAQEDHLTVRYTGGRLVESRLTDYCSGVFSRRCTSVRYVQTVMAARP